MNILDEQHVIVEIRGGMGNQFFQYAAARNLALKHDCKLYFETSGFAKRDDFGFALSSTNAVGEVLPESLGISPRKMRKQRFLPRWLTRTKSRFIDEPSLLYSADLLTSDPPLYLKGYFQSASYFAENRNQIVHEVKPLSKLETAAFRAQALADRKAKTLVSVHVRRGDYLKPKVIAHLGVLNTDYYVKAMDKLTAMLSGPLRFVVFSDDEHAAAHMFADTKFDICMASNFISQIQQGDDPAIDDMLCMSACDHHVIANSSFSWWGAAFGHNPEREVICPSPWFVDGTSVGFENSIGGCTPLPIER